MSEGPDRPGDAPKDLKAVRALIEDRRVRMPKRLVQVADFAITHPQEIAFGTVAGIAQQAEVQPSALVRFAQALGYAGFSDLQAVFRNHARERWPEYRERLEALQEDGAAADDPARLLQGLVGASATSIERLGETVDPAALQGATALLGDAATIYLLGLRRSAPVTLYLAYALSKLGLRCELLGQVAGLAPEQVALATDRDVLLAVSFTPYAADTLELTRGAAARGVPIVAITDSPFSPLVQTATVWLEVVEADHAGFRTLAGTLALAATLAVAAAGRRRRDAIARKGAPVAAAPFTRLN